MPRRRHKKNDYFQMFVDNMDYVRQSAHFVQSFLTDFNPDAKHILQQMEDIHKIEHAGDLAKHELMAHLAKEFITPIEREDIIVIAKSIDDLTDSIEDILQQIYIFNVHSIRPEALEFIDIIVRLVNELTQMFLEFRHFKKSEPLHGHIVEINRLEEEGDALYIRATRKLYEEGNDPVSTIGWTRLYDQLENTCDLCEDTADMIEGVIMNNS